MKSEPYRCDICGMIFVNEKELVKHSEQKMFQCQSCNAFFESKEDFEKHAIQHSKKSNYNIGKTATTDKGKGKIDKNSIKFKMIIFVSRGEEV
jgi:uncharacterized C2H2 Zn-finger protein